MWRALIALSWAHTRHHAGRQAVVLLAVALGVALASSVQMINHSALDEFTQAVRATQGEPDVVLVADGTPAMNDSVLALVARDESVAAIGAVLELETHARADAAATRWPVRVIGVDALQVAAVAPSLWPQTEGAGDGSRWPFLSPRGAWLNTTASARLGASTTARSLQLQSATGWHTLDVLGRIAAAGPPVIVLDIAAAQALFGRMGQLSRIDIRLAQGVAREAWQAGLALPPGVRATVAAESTQRVSNLSRAYRVNLTVLALVALLVGGFLVYSVTMLSVAQRGPELALLGVLGLPGAARRRLVLVEAALLGLCGSALGLLAGAGLALVALRLLGGDLGGGYFPGVQPTLRWPVPWLAACGLLGIAAACAGAWWPARAAERVVPAQALKGMGSMGTGPTHSGRAACVLAAGAALALAPPIAGLPLAAYGSVALLLVGGVAIVPGVVQAVLQQVPAPRTALPLLAVRRARYARHAASAAMAGVVASLALAVAITVMVGSFRQAVSTWLDRVLPADLNARSAGTAAAAEHAPLPAGLVAAAASVPGVAQVRAGRTLPLPATPGWPPVTLLARPIDDAAGSLPLVGALLPLPPGEVAAYASEAAAALHGWTAGQRIEVALGSARTPVYVRAIFRDYARQHGALAIDLGDYQRLSGDGRLSELAVWLQPGHTAEAVAVRLRELAGPDAPLEIASTAELRRVSLAIFDRSFAVTRYLQAVAIGVGLVGVAASLAAQVLARRKEFALLAHLGLTRGQTVRLVTAEAAVWLLAGCVVGMLLGLAMAAVLVHVVNPQSFHWTMPMTWDVATLTTLAAAVAGAGIATAAWTAHRATAQSAPRAVREDW